MLSRDWAMPPGPVALYGPAPPKFSWPTMKLGSAALVPLTENALGESVEKTQTVKADAKVLTLLGARILGEAALHGTALLSPARLVMVALEASSAAPE